MKLGWPGWLTVLLFGLLSHSVIGVETPPAGSPFASITPVPVPDLSEMRPEVEQALVRSRNDLDALLVNAETDRTELADAFGNTGLLYHAHLLLEAAASCYGNAQLLSPKDYRWPYYLAYLQHQQGELIAAQAGYERALSIAPELSIARLRLGQVILELGRLNQALPLLQQAAEDQMLSAAAWYELGKLAYAKGDYGAARDRLRQVLELNPSATRVHYTLALALRGLGEDELARHHLTLRGEGVPLLPDSLLDVLGELSTGQMMLFHYGMSAAYRGDYRAAASFFRDGAALDPDNLDARVSLARFLYLSGEPEPARLELLSVLQRKSEHVLANFMLGVLAVGAHDTEQAISRFNSVLRLEPHHSGAHYYLGNVALQGGDPAAAAEHYRMSLQQIKDNVSARLGQIQAATLAGVSYQSLRDMLETAYQLHPDEQAFSYYLALLLATSPEQRIRDGKRAVLLAHSLTDIDAIPEYLELLAMAYAESGDFVAAVEILQSVLQEAFAQNRIGWTVHLVDHLQRYDAKKPIRAPFTLPQLFALAQGNIHKTVKSYPTERPY